MNLKLRAALTLGLMSLAGAAAALPIVGVTGDNRLIYTDTVSPQLAPLVVNITGLQPGETILGIDTRPANGELFALGSTGRLYRIGNGFTGGSIGGAVQIGNGPGFTPAAGVTYGFDFNPSVDRIRIVGSDSSNLRYNPTVADTVTPLAATDTTLAPATNAVGAAYDRSVATTGGLTTLFLVDASADALVRQGGVDGTPSPNGGAVTSIGPLGVDIGAAAGFDISAGATGFVAGLVANGSLYTVNLATGAASLSGAIAGGTTITDFTFVPAIPNQQSTSQVIPTLSPVTLAALLGALGLLGLVALRRKS